MKRLSNEIFLGLALALSAAAGLARRAGAAEAIDATYPADRIDEIDVETAAGAVSFDANAEKVVTVTGALSGDECATINKAAGGVLTLAARGASKKTFALDKVCAAGFKISAPPSTRIKARTVAGSVDVGQFSGRVEVKAGSGDISLRRPSGNLDLHAGRGGVSGTATGPRISVVARYGAVDLRDLTGSVAVRGGDAGVSLTWASAPNRGDILVQTSAGDQNISLPSGAAIAVSMRSVSGKTASAFANDPRSNLRLDLRSTTGAIAVRRSTGRP